MLPSETLEDRRPAFRTEHPEGKKQQKGPHDEREAGTVALQKDPLMPGELQVASCHVDVVEGAAVIFPSTAFAT